ncbi:response regulator transcription factor [Nocardioides daeguensis]|uniref:Response regulator transcription factor n=1 Tax=Nocardioides daeguensis TaxID=908359 RepID=A0ABP6W6J5_9ACTN|nr:response regulator transcription factor [Nocardioides daeguensis]MBV6729833.1 response regulator transcription factor [Nocardioides daeguensis]MCR1774339.1 response regulator transcription factor [Nocardioides daeguensis]
MRVLVVEDETRLAAALADGLRREGHSVDVAADGAEGVWFAEENTYDVIVLDLMLPVIDGYEVCRRLREQRNWTPVLMLTARDADRDMVTGLDAGADDYVTKPFSFEVLLARLRSLARRQVAERPTTVVVGDLELDPATRQVTRRGQALDVTAREFAVLEHLMRNCGRVVTKAQLMGAVWGFDFDGDPNIVEVYVGRLRRKVDKPFDTETIETVRGGGYRARAER